MNNLAKVLQEKDLSQTALSKAIGSTPAYISLLAKGTYTPKVDLAVRIAIVLGVSVQDIWPAEDIKSGSCHCGEQS